MNSAKPDWVRVSIHPTMTNKGIDYFISSLNETIHHIDIWKLDYKFDPKKNAYQHHDDVQFNISAMFSMQDNKVALA
ncbi:hypothetical protein [Chengkuizengella axinellae]|uniref:Uncharacterized protein n=1 Tax=Chengkuizengella axinellae TaxID=3064388 RepID=A0ABT9IUQ2_9BACL|nr:hypothetical protein [Chengkuizengella sp. 2205SS18-9]MDP5272594.1 hypothetical protein [Chengkuizengella sp. 2205SS18-9]